MGRLGDPYATDTLRRLLPQPSAVPPAALDQLLACGELIAAVVFAEAVARQGIAAVTLAPHQLGIMTTGQPGSARIVDVQPHYVRAAIVEDIVPVVPGFIGVSDDGTITTLGRGSSDTTAAALGAALGASVVELYKEFGPIHDADPRLTDGAQAVAQMSYEDLLKITTRDTATPVHPEAIAIARRARIPLRICGVTDRRETIVAEVG
jgi:aspartate kinase